MCTPDFILKSNCGFYVLSHHLDFCIYYIISFDQTIKNQIWNYYPLTFYTRNERERKIRENTWTSGYKVFSIMVFPPPPRENTPVAGYLAWLSPQIYKFVVGKNPLLSNWDQNLDRSEIKMFIAKENLTSCQIFYFFYYCKKTNIFIAKWSGEN